MSTKKEVAIQSAQTVSVLRAVAAEEKDPFVQSGDYLAKHFLTKKYKLFVSLLPHRLIKMIIHFSSPGSYCFMISRTKHFDQTLLREIDAGVKQVVILGAGYDTRPFRFADKLKGIPVFEVDFPGTQSYKREKLQNICQGNPPGLTFIPLDFNKTPFDRALIENGFSPNLKTLFLWEGVSYYLAEPVVKQVLGFVSCCAVGSSILFDYATKDFVNGDRSSYGGKHLARWLEKIKEPFLFGMNSNQTKGFVSNCRLSLVSDYGPDEVENMYLKTRKGQVLGRTLGHVRMAHAKVTSH
ncbi:MAG: SAM-dependent methyltransferase [Chitinophagaceae bacterium]